MSKERKKLLIFYGILGLIMLLITVPMVIYGEVTNKPDLWIGYIIMTITDGVCVVLMLISCIIFIPGIIKRENLKLESENDFNILNLTGEVKNEFEVFHSEIIKATFLQNEVEFSKIKFGPNGLPVIKNEQKILKHQKISANDFCLETLTVPYSNLEFSVVTTRLNWRAVPKIGIAIKLPSSVVEKLQEPDNYVIASASKELLYYILGTGNKLINQELLTEKKLEIKPKALKKYSYSKLSWLHRLLICLGVFGAGVLIGVYLNVAIATVVVFLISIMVIMQPSIKVIFYEKYFGDGVRLCSLKEITKIFTHADVNKPGKMVIAVVTPIVTLIYPYTYELWKYLTDIMPNKIDKNEQA